MPDIPAGFCQCGCGNKTKIASNTQRKNGAIKGQPNRFLNGHNQRGPIHSLWKGGTSYEVVSHPEHREGLREHVYRAEKVLGKPVPPKAVVHHVNGSKRGGPLVICQDTAYHRLLHRREKSLKTCGHANWRKCWICKQYDAPENLRIAIRKKTGREGPITHPACQRIYNQERKNGKL